ncbi:MAG: hypothetical protein ACLGI2_02800 [Acidimicrobiia bacterium]
MTEGQLEGELEPQTLAVAPDGRGFWTVRLRNGTAAAAVCRATVGGDAAAWTWLSPDHVRLEPGEDGELRVSIRLPPPPSPAAGRVQVPVEVRGGPAGSLSLAATLEVLPVVDLGLSVTPGGQVTVRNRGNLPTRAALSVEGPAQLDSSWVELEAGGSTTVRLSARGRPGDAYTVRAEPEAGPAATVGGVVPGPAGRGGRTGRRAAWKVVAPVLAMVALVAGVLVTGGGGTGTDGEDDVGIGEQQRASADCPVAGHLAPDPAGLPRRNVPLPDDYSFLEVRPGGCEPVRFNPCEPVHYVVNSALAPPGAVADLEEAFEQLSRATGIEFVNDGPTDEPASLVRRPFQPERYGNRWAPILVAWDHGEAHRLRPTNPGGGRPYNGGGVYVSGILILNVDAVTDERRRTPLDSGFGPGASWGRVLIHELGHLAGLGHVRASKDIMFDDLGVQTGRAEYHRGDLDGLRLLGREAGCLTPPAVPPVPR